MTSITLTCGVNAVTLSGNLIYGTDFYPERLNHFTLPTADGTDVVYDTGPTIMHTVLVIDNVSKNDAASLRDWFLTKAVFSLNTFTVSAIPNVDLGNGTNTSLTGVRYEGGSSLKDIFTPKPPGIYQIKIPVKWKKA